MLCCLRPTQTLVTTFGSRHFQKTPRLETSSQANGTVKAIVTTKGLSKREFNGLRARLEKVDGVKWSHPVNLKNGLRKIEGVVASGSAQQTALRRLEEFTGRRV